MTTKRTSLKLPDERIRLFERAADIIRPEDDPVEPPRADIIDAALTHLIESEANLRSARDDGMSPTEIQRFNTSVLKLRYRTSILSDWRK
jgi:hypothetical protein